MLFRQMHTSSVLECRPEFGLIPDDSCADLNCRMTDFSIAAEETLKHDYVTMSWRQRFAEDLRLQSQKVVLVHSTVKV